MRVLMVVLALVATPFAFAVSQSANGSDCDNGQGDEHRSDSGQEHAHQGQCVIPPSGCAVAPPQTGGTAAIEGKVFDANAGTGLAGWCVDLTGPVAATAQTDDLGMYSFAGLPDGTYLVCEEPQPGWVQVFPPASFGAPCPGGFGWSFSVAAGDVAQLVNFGNVTAQ